MRILNLFGEVANKIVAIVLIILAVSLLAIYSYMAQMKHQTRIVAEVISAEACSEGPWVMFGVGSTIKNRMTTRDLTAYQVVSQPKQYYGFTNQSRSTIFKDTRCSEPALFIAENIETLPDIVDGAIYFRFKHEPKRSWHKNLTTVINNCEFYK